MLMAVRFVIDFLLCWRDHITYLWVMENMKMIFSSSFLSSQALCNTLFAPLVEDQTPLVTEARRLCMLVDFMMKTFDYFSYQHKQSPVLTDLLLTPCGRVNVAGSRWRCWELRCVESLLSLWALKPNGGPARCHTGGASS